MMMFFRTLDLAPTEPLSEFLSRAKRVCEASLDDLNERFSKQPEWKRIALCFNAVYMYELLTFGLRFPPHTNDPRYKPPVPGKKVKNSDLDFSNTNLHVLGMVDYQSARKKMIILILFFLSYED
jgi:hypothetical protein